MRWTSFFLPLVLWASSSLAAKKPTQDRFSQFHAKQLATTPIKLADDLHRQLTAVPRDYAVVTLLTALEPRLGCRMCTEFQPEWDLLTRSWVKGDKAGESRIIFGTLDFADGRETFMALGLQTAPLVLIYPPTTGPHAVKSGDPLKYDFSHGFASAEQIHTWISRHTPGRPHPALKRPVNMIRLVVTSVLSLGALAVAVAAFPYILPIIQNRNVWAAGSLIAILLFTSGYMFNHIRKVPYVAGDGRGGIAYIANGFQSQYGLETQIVAAIYGVLAFCTISLAVKVPRVANPSNQKVAVLVWSGLMLVFYSVLMGVFRMKNAGYPFYLPPFL